MILEHTFSVPAGIDEAWKFLNDPERVAPCMPGATLDSFEGDDIAGRVKVKVGAIQMSYKMKGRFVERDEEKHRLVIEGAGKENRGAGTVNATVTLTLTENGSATDALVETDLAITGRPAQFGRGALEDIGGKIVGQFAKNLATQFDELAPAAAEAAAPAADTAAPAAAAPAAKAAAKPVENEPLDLVSVLSPDRDKVIKIAAAVLVTFGLGFLIGRITKRG
ncbi:SRPBCC family protein [Gordonia paraffinivorans]|uniref:SRPBCC family protein n=1 Tax=Gordonia paraffinivorans TaxID=175628 RepID=UPI0014456441|nr:SRPBCC family protein [Gordonia paraffinivorans]